MVMMVSVCHLDMGIPAMSLEMLRSSEPVKQTSAVEAMVICEVTEHCACRQQGPALPEQDCFVT